MPRLIAAIVRHGAYRQLPHTPSAHQPFPLLPQGEQQARDAADGLRVLLLEQPLRLDAEVDCSQLLRAWQTARIMAESLRDLCPVEPTLNACEALAERGLGSAANLSVAQIEAAIHDDPRFPDLPPDWKSNSHFRLPLQGAESLLEAGERVARHLDTQMRALARRTDADTLKLFVGHGAAFRHAAYHLGALALDDIARLSMFHAQPVLLEFQTDGAWRHVGGTWKVRGRDTHYTD